MQKHVVAIKSSGNVISSRSRTMAASSFPDGDDSVADEESHQPLLTARTANGHARTYSAPSTPELRGMSPSSPSLWYLLSGLLRHNRGLTAVLLVVLLVLLPPYVVHLSHTRGAERTSKAARFAGGLHSFHPTDYLPLAAEPVLRNTTRDARSDQPASAFIASTAIDRTHLAKPLAAVDAAFAALQRWPRVDLLVRTFHGSALFMPLLFQSIELFWPRNIGRCLIIADAHSAKDEKILAFSHLIPEWCELHYETVPPEMIHNGRWTMQWSNFWADNYTAPDAQFVAIADTDSFFTHKVTPDLYFDAQGRVVHGLHASFQRGFWDKDTLWWLGGPEEMVAYNKERGWANDAVLNELYPLNFMQNLPQLYPVDMFPAYRDYALQKHAKAGAKFSYFDGLNSHFLTTAYDNPSQFCLLGNFLAFFSPQRVRDRVAVLIADGRQLRAGATAVERAHQLVLRPTMHMPYTDIYNTGHPPKVVCDGQRYDYQKMYQVVLYFTWVQLCQLQNAVRQYHCTVTVDDALKHQHEAVLYATGHTEWSVSQGDDGKRLVYEHVYLARQRWLRGALRAVVAGGVESGVVYLEKFPDHVAFDQWWVQQKDANVTRPFGGDPLPSLP